MSHDTLMDTHCHLNLLVDSSFDMPLSKEDLEAAGPLLEEAALSGVMRILNVGTSLIESMNCIALAQRYASIFACIGIHPNDLTENWKSDLAVLEKLLPHKEAHKILAIGECGLDMHYPDYDLLRQKEAFAQQIELALAYDLALVVHTRDAGEDTLRCLEPFAGKGLRGTIHCFSEDLSFARQAIEYGFVLGIGGTITYPKNTRLREVVQAVGLDHIILETDAPFLPPQIMRGKKNHPKYIKEIAQFIAELLGVDPAEVAQKTTHTALTMLRIHDMVP